jgi:hypothetical protein
MQPEWLIAIPAIFGLGFIMGYFVRAMISRRRRRRARLSGWREDENQVRLERPPAPSISPDSNSNSLRRAADAPALFEIDVADPVSPVGPATPVGSSK